MPFCLMPQSDVMWKATELAIHCSLTRSSIQLILMTLLVDLTLKRELLTCTISLDSVWLKQV